jgi:hypothetical protein
MVAKKQSKKSTKKLAVKASQTGKKRAPKKVENARNAKVERGTSGTGPRITGAAGRAKKAKEKP